jgi:hypothetical protein
MISSHRPEKTPPGNRRSAQSILFKCHRKGFIWGLGRRGNI